jgi:pyrrolysine biosynthesis protein PylD
MTRLQSDDISGIPSQLIAYDEELLLKTGHNLRQIACHAVELKEEVVRGAMPAIRVSIVPIRWGQGVIEGFCAATAAILRHLGFDSFVTAEGNVSGLAEAYEARADGIFLADDHDFVVLNTRTHQYIHNANATGRGFAAGLDLMTGGLAGRKVLVLGCGAVGRRAAASLLRYGASVSIYDIDPRLCREFKGSSSGPDATRLKVESDFHEGLSGHSLIVDATNAAGIIGAENISSETFIAAPGIPLGLTRSAVKKVSGRLLHDPLQIGVATMGMGAVKQLVENEASAFREARLAAARAGRRSE